MRMTRLLTGGILLCLVSAWAAPGFSQQVMEGDVPAVFEPEYAVYPSYRIDNTMSTIGIIGSANLTEPLTILFRDKTDIRVVGPTNLQAIFAGKVITYGTGLTIEEAQVLAQRFQIDHVLFAEANTAPYQEYKSGGKAYSAVHLKIVDIRNGDTIFQASSNVGARFGDPRLYGYTAIKESAIDPIKAEALALVLYDLRYALGDTMLGCDFGQTRLNVTAVWLNSVAANADMRVGDIVKSVDGVNVSNTDDLLAALRLHPIMQGDVVGLEVERSGQVLRKTLSFPVIPMKQSREAPQMGK